LSTGTLEDLNPLELLELDSALPRGPPTLASDDDDSNSKEVWELKAEKEISEYHSRYNDNGTHETTEQKPLNGYNSRSNLVEDSSSVKSLSATISGLPCSITVTIKSYIDELNYFLKVCTYHNIGYSLLGRPAAQYQRGHSHSPRGEK
jgi:hypothetical protein